MLPQTALPDPVHAEDSHALPLLTRQFPDVPGANGLRAPELEFTSPVCPFPFNLNTSKTGGVSALEARPMHKTEIMHA